MRRKTRMQRLLKIRRINKISLAANSVALQKIQHRRRCYNSLPEYHPSVMALTQQKLRTYQSKTAGHSSRSDFGRQLTPRHCSAAVGRKPLPSPFPYNNIEFCLFRTSHLPLLCSVADSRSAVIQYCLIGIPELNCAEITFRGPSSTVGGNKNVWM